MRPFQLVNLLPADFVGGNVLVIGIDGLNNNFIYTVSAKAGKLLVIDNEKSSAVLDRIQVNCDVDYVLKESIKSDTFPSCSFVLCNGVMDSEIASLCMSCLLPDGYVMLITNCVQVDESVLDTPEMTTYSVDQVLKTTPSINSFGFVFVASRIVERYEDGHILYSSVFKKVLLDPKQDRRLDSLHDVLNDRTYTRKRLQMMSKLFSREGDPGFISTGGAEETEECLKQLKLQPGQRVLDVGCGAGGPLIQTAKKYKTHALGVDISSNMVDEATKLFAKHRDLNIELEVCDIERREFPEGYFDAIYSKDVILHIVRKQDLLKKFLKWLKPGGKLLITDYCRTENEFSDIMQKYLANRDNIWFLITIPAYVKHFKDAGFINVDVKDKQEAFREYAVKENVHIEKQRDELLKEFHQKFLDDWFEHWKSRIKLIENKDLMWGIFYGEKPVN